MNISQLLPNSPDYPDALRHIHRPPKQLFIQGQLEPEKIHLAIVGTRSSTAYGREIAYNLALELARAGLVIVSGLASGIDTKAHEGALDAGGLTVAVQGRGLNDVFPAENRGLAQRIVASGGAIISEYEPTEPPLAWRFPERNRLVAGLCQGVIVVESGVKGGAMLTAGLALKENRTVMAVPGNLTSASSVGCNNLIATGKAQLIRDSSDVLQALELPAGAIPVLAPIGTQSPHETKIMELLTSGTTTTQELIEATGFGAADFANVISLMEITGKVRNLGTGHWAARR
jgi:DNA processing protein